MITPTYTYELFELTVNCDCNILLNFIFQEYLYTLHDTHLIPHCFIDIIEYQHFILISFIDSIRQISQWIDMLCYSLQLITAHMFCLSICSIIHCT